MLAVKEIECPEVALKWLEDVKQPLGNYKNIIHILKVVFLKKKLT